jgi:hypothetical protein
MNEYREIASMLRTLIRHTNMPETPIHAEHIRALAELCEDKADDIELDMIVEMQRKELT